MSGGAEPAPAVEVRVPTFRRPALLRRALASLVAQTEPDWVAVVLDDSPGREGGPVVADLGDRRVEYRPNPRNLGAAGNLDQCFAPAPLAGGRWACILEDDNSLLPGCLAANIAAADAAGVSLLFRNQAVEEPAGEAGGRRTGATTLGHIYTPGVLTVTELLPAAFFTAGGISNGALFWRTDGPEDLRIGPAVTDSMLQESARLLRIAGPVSVELDPLAVWRDNGAESANFTPAAWRAGFRRRRRLLGIAALRREAFRRLRAAGAPALPPPGRFAAPAAAIQRGLLRAGVSVPTPDLPAADRAKCRAYGLLVRGLLAVAPDPLRGVPPPGEPPAAPWPARS